VEVTLNGQQFTADGQVFQYLGEPHVHDVQPAAGPASGGTSVNITVPSPSDFDAAAQIMCAFGGALVSAVWHSEDQVLSCRTPASSAGTVVLTLSYSRDGHVLASGEPRPFVFYPPVQVAAVEPWSGPVGGATRMVVRGTWAPFGAGPLSCRVGGAVVPATLELFGASVRCSTPPKQAPEQAALVEVSMNGQQYHQGNASFHYYARPVVLAVSPASGPTLGGTPVTVSGLEFAASSNNLCRWGAVTTDVIVLSAVQLACSSPSLSAGIHGLAVTQNGQQYTSEVLNFSLYLPPRIHFLSLPGVVGDLGSWLAAKVTVPVSGYIPVRVWGSGFMGGTDYRCKINSHSPISATYDDLLDCIVCWSDLWMDGPNTVEVTLNGQEYTSDGMNVTVNMFW
jgi:hypothetical protein